MKPLVNASRLKKIYGDPESPTRTVALQEASLQIYPGEVVSIMGPSGSGKTTLVSILGCILKPTSGELLLDGLAVTAMKESELPEIRRKYVGFVFQSYNLFGSLTVRENVEIALRLKRPGGAGIRREAEELLDQVGLSHRKNFLPSDLSGGEKQRVAIARALGGDPPLILADEPTANLDSRVGGEILKLFESLAKEQNKCVVIVTHDPRISKIEHRPIHIEDGRIQEVAYVA
ncbi:MAG TPA: ABC transporter ATP-binding protein [Acidobacteriota bacterium]|nr:ABC transporter ATP-binding protein [Acidobacteriota bacterium]